MDADTLQAGIEYLIEVDHDLAGIHARFGSPEPWRRPPTFATLVLLILEQQVSLASAAAAYRRLTAELGGPPVPGGFLQLDDATLRMIGFSRQKASYCRGIAEELEAGRLVLDDLGGLADGEARARLLKLRGVGDWTADCYLLGALGRPDVWPAGDRALQVAIAAVKRLPVPPSSEETLPIAEAWRPWRSVAARMLWHHYLRGSLPPAMG